MTAVSKLSLLSKLSTLVADTGDIDAIAKLQPVDATTNPSLLLKAAQSEAGKALLTEAFSRAKQQGTDNLVANTCDHFAVLVGEKILNVIPGRISTEVDARLSFDKAATLAKAKQLIALYAAQGIDKSKVLIKIAATWEGIQAARELEQQGINCNLTLIFGLPQARACAEAGVFLISPFVGRILDWHKAKGNPIPADPLQDPGVVSVRTVYQFFKQHQFSTVVMAASFRSIDQVLALAGCDRLTIAPNLLEQLAEQTGDVPAQLINDLTVQPKPTALSEAQFRWQFNQDALAVEKLAEGIRLFAQDQERLEALVATLV